MLIAFLTRMASASDHSARRLYHAIIVAGSALVSGAACSDDGESKQQRYSQPANGGETKAAAESESDGAAGAEAEGAEDTTTTGMASPWW
jgi:hypothetical protein